jgi:hypothetical protein
VVGTLLIRRHAWVRRAQIVVLLMAVAVAWGRSPSTRSPPTPGSTSCRCTAWRSSPRSTSARCGDDRAAGGGPLHRAGPGAPLNVGGLIAFWAATSVAFVTLRAFG